MEAYKPTPEEVRKAEEMMPDELKAERAVENETKVEELANKPMRFNALKEARDLGFEMDVRNEIAEKMISSELAADNFDGVLRLRKYASAAGLINVMPGGSENDLQWAAEKDYQKEFESGNFLNAMSLARELHGRSSYEYFRAEKAYEEMEEKKKDKFEKEESTAVLLSRNATIGDLLAKLGGNDYMDNEFFDAVRKEFPDLQADLAASDLSMELTDFFKAHGYNMRDITSSLPIKFRKVAQKKKK